MKNSLLLFVFISTFLNSQDREVLYWVAPMDANFIRDVPGKSPMGMDLVPVYADEVDNKPGVKVAPEVIQTLGIRTKVAEISKLWRAINTIGTIVANPNKQQLVQIHTSGWIKALYINEVGEPVKKGDVLFTLLSHELVNAEEDYLQILAMGNKKLTNASKNRLLNLGMSQGQIKTLNKTRKTIDFINVLAPQDGFIESINIAQGMFIKPQNKIITIIDLSEVWLKADVVENKSNWLQVNQAVDVELISQVGETIEATIDYIYPFLNDKTRTVSVRVKIKNNGNKLKPNMFANITIYTGVKKDIVVIPKEAVIRSGHENRVILATGGGRFEAKAVRLGIESGNFIEILSGVKQGDEVVVSGQFLLDSEASLKASITRMSKTGSTTGKDDD